MCAILYSQPWPSCSADLRRACEVLRRLTSGTGVLAFFGSARGCRRWPLGCSQVFWGWQNFLECRTNDTARLCPTCWDGLLECVYMPVRILIADDNDEVRSAISDILRREGWVVCGSFADGQTAVDGAAELKPDVVVLDLQMPARNGLSAGCAIRTFLPSVPVLIYSTFASSCLEEEAKRLGFQGVIQKGDTAALTSAIRSVLSERVSVRAKASAD